MQRLTADDRVRLWPDPLWRQEIGALAVLDGPALPAPHGRPRIGAVRAPGESRPHLVPRFRQPLYTPGRGLGGPLWADARRTDRLRQGAGAPPVPGYGRKPVCGRGIRPCAVAPDGVTVEAGLVVCHVSSG